MKRIFVVASLVLLAMSVSCSKTDSDVPGGKGSVAETAPAAEDPPVDMLDECQSLLDKARKMRSTDPKAALEILDEAFQRLHDCTYTANQVYWLQMKSELDEARVEFTESPKDPSR